jgi:hypothetical protein
VDIENVDIDIENISIQKSELQPTLFFLLIAPLDLIQVGISGAMFIILSRHILSPHVGSGAEMSSEISSSTQQTLIFLFGAAGLWHLGSIVWWLFWLGNDIFSLSSICIHAIFGTVHISSLFVWRHFASQDIYSSRKRLFDWIGVGWFFSIISVVYVVRMSWYAKSLIDAAEKHITKGST